MKVKTDNFTRERFSIPKQIWISRVSFISGNIALNNLSIKVIDAKVNNLDYVELTASEMSGLILHGIAYAKKGSPLGKLREIMTKKSIEEGKSVVYGLPKNIVDHIINRYPEIGEEFQKTTGMELSLPVLVKETIKDMFSYETERRKATKEVNEEFKKLKEAFIEACRRDVVNPWNKIVIGYYENMINKTVKTLESKKAVEKSEIYEKAYTSAIYSIQRSSMLYQELMLNGKMIGDILIPDKRDELSVFKAESNAKEIFTKVKKVFDPDFHFGKLKEEIIDPLRNIYSQKEIPDIVESLKKYTVKVINSIDIEKGKPEPDNDVPEPDNDIPEPENGSDYADIEF